jgi:hypothetical protein
MLEFIPAGARQMQKASAGRLRPVVMAGALVAAFASPLVSQASAQGLDCSRLQAQIASMPSSGDPNLAARYTDAARKQQSELERTQAYAQSIGCGNRQFLFFGSAPPQQCGGLEAQIQRMKGNLATLQAQARTAADGGRSDLVARFNASCRSDQRPRNSGFLDNLFGNGDRQSPQQQQPQGIDDPNMPPVDDTPRSGSKAVCVRTCDGGFFPVSFSARRGGFAGLEELCHALCPNAETRLYTYPPNGDIEQAVGADGTPYKALPNALKFRTKFDSTCTCKPANQSWVQALADAENLLGGPKADIIVTQKKSEEMSRATTPGAKPKVTPAKGGALQADTDRTLAQEAAANAQSPTASNESAGIASGAGRTAKTYGLKDGQTREEPSPDGGTRKVRIIGPTL